MLERAKAAGIDGILVTDLPVGADPKREKWLGDSELAFVRLVAPTTPLDRMREIALNGSGFVYLISRLGVTGARHRSQLTFALRRTGCGMQPTFRFVSGSGSPTASRREQRLTVPTASLSGVRL